MSGLRRRPTFPQVGLGADGETRTPNRSITSPRVPSPLSAGSGRIVPLTCGFFVSFIRVGGGSSVPVHVCV